MTKSEEDTKAHIARVRFHIAHVLANLAERSNVHDLSKLEEPELSGYESLRESLMGVRYGTAAYRAALAEHDSVIEHHYEYNSHHPECWPNGIADMSLLDIIEMLCDWRAAAERDPNGFGYSLEASIAHFNLDDDSLSEILLNTAIELGWLE